MPTLCVREGTRHGHADQGICRVLQRPLRHVQQDQRERGQRPPPVEVAEGAAQRRRLPGEVSGGWRRETLTVHLGGSNVSSISGSPWLTVMVSLSKSPHPDCFRKSVCRRECVNEWVNFWQYCKAF